MRKTPNLHMLLMLTALGIVNAQDSLPDTTGAQSLARTSVQAQVRPLDNLGMAPLRISPREWEGKGKSLADILATHAGIQTRRTGGMGSFQAISIRGVAGNKVLVCIDGIPIDDAGGSAVNLGAMDLNQFERIDVYKGQVPAAFGGNGIGGVVNLVTRKSSRTSGRLFAQYGSHNTGESALTLSSRLSDSTRWTSSLSWRFSDNDYRFYDRNGTMYNTDDDHYSTRKNAQFSQFSGNHQWSFLEKSGELRILLSHSQQEGGLPGTESQQTQVAGFKQDWIAPKIVWLNPTWSNGIRMETELGGRIEKSTLHWSNLIDGLGYSIGNTDYQQVGSRTLRADGALRFFGEWQKPYGLEWHLSGFGEQLDPRDQPMSTNAWQWRLQRHSATSALEGTLAPHRWIALQANHQVTSQIDHNSGGVVHSNFPDTLPAESKSTTMQSAQGTLRIGPSEAMLRGNLSAGHHYRIPALQELFSTSLGVVANPDLKPEQGERAELGLEFTSKSTRAQVSWFWNQVRDGIFWTHSGGFAKPENLSRSETVGLEAEVHSSPIRFLDLALQTTLQDPRNTSQADAYEGNLSPNEPKVSVGAESTVRIGKRWDLSYRAEWRSEVFRDPANQMRIAPQASHNIGMSYVPWEKGRLRLAVNNLSGAEIQDVYSAYPTPGRQYFASITQEF